MTESILGKLHDRVRKVIPKVMAYLSDSDDEVIQKVITKVMTCLGDSDDAVSCLARNVLDEFEQGKILVKLS